MSSEELQNFNNHVIQEDFDYGLSQTQVPEKINKILDWYQEWNFWNEDLTKSIIEIFQRWRNVARIFALRSENFAHLKAQDQEKLLNQNLELCVQYIICRFLTSDNRKDQLYWLLGVSFPNFRFPYAWIHVDFEIFNKYQNLTYECLKFKQNIDKFTDYFINIPKESTAFVFNLLLFNVQDLDLDEICKVKALKNQAKELILLDFDGKVFCQLLSELVPLTRPQKTFNFDLIPLGTEALKKAVFQEKLEVFKHFWTKIQAYSKIGYGHSKKRPRLDFNPEFLQLQRLIKIVFKYKTANFQKQVNTYISMCK